ncbi:hypothetical protein U9M48_038414 [Paspalum notatum var. saurae]|uniref:Uncharacterized protein n=1 Tax=Paspalum notatum var. saurae TaxID=547442 RepID=A0AAQ3UHI8_PASNO
MMPSMDSVSNDGPVESPAPAAEAAVPKSSPVVATATTKGPGLRRWRRIRRDQEQHRDGYATAAAGGSAVGGGDEDSVQLNKRRLPLGADAPKAKHEAAAVEAENSTASVESRFVPPRPLDPGLGRLVASAGFSVGAGSDNSEERSSRSSTAASAPRVLPRHDHALPFPRERERDRRNPRAARWRADTPTVVHSAAVSADADSSRSSVESDLRSSSNAALKGRRSGAGLNGAYKVFSDYCDHSDEEKPSEGVRSSTGYSKENGSSVVGRSVRICPPDSGYDLEEEDTFDEESVGKGQNGRMHSDSGADAYNDSIMLLQRTQEALENEIKNIMAVGEEPSDDFDVHDDQWRGSAHLREPIEEAGERIKHLKSRFKEVSTPIKEKVSRIHELGAIPGRMQPGKTTIENTNLLLSQSELDRLYQEKIEAEIQCTILTRAFHASSTLFEDQMALWEAQKSLSEDYRQLGLKLRHTEKRAMLLEDMAEKLQVQSKELSNSSEVLKLQSKASRVSLFCFVQFILLCIAIGTYLMRLSPSSTEVIPT